MYMRCLGIACTNQWLKIWQCGIPGWPKVADDLDHRHHQHQHNNKHARYQHCSPKHGRRTRLHASPSTNAQAPPDALEIYSLYFSNARLHI